MFADNVLDERVILVTGGGTGLGKAAARELAACWALSVVIAGKRAAILAAAADEIGRAASYTWPVTSASLPTRSAS